MQVPKHLSALTKYSIVPAIFYCVPVLFFLKDNTYSQTWLLYLGNALFLAGIFIISVISDRMSNSGPNVSNNGFTVTILGIIVSVIIIGILLAFFLPGPHGDIANTTKRLPPATRRTTGSLVFMLIANALIGNFIAGTFATLLGRGSAVAMKSAE